MRNVCDSCEYSKNKGEFIYCVKYGVPIWKERVYCISWKQSTERSNDVNKIWTPDEVPQSEDGD